MKRAGTLPERAQGHLFTVDTDVHIHEDPKTLGGYCEAPWNRILLTAKDTPERYLSVRGLSPVNLDDTMEPRFPSGTVLRTVNSAAQMRRELDAIDVDAAIVFPDHLLKIALFPDPEQAMALARAYNRWLLDEGLGKERGLVGALCIAPQDPEGSAAEAKKHGRKERVACLYFPTAGLQRLYGDRDYDALYETAEKLDIPIMLHGVSAISTVFPFNLEQYGTAVVRHALAHPLSMIANLMSMISSGVPARFPKLRIGFAEGAISWVPWVMMRLDKEYLERRRELPFLDERPSHYVQRFYFGTQPIEEPERAADYVKLVELIGRVESIMFSSDWPHHDFDHPRKLLSYPLPAEAKRKIMGENAMEFLRMDKASLLG